MDRFPSHWADFISQNNLADQSFCIPEESDESGVGADLQLMTLKDAIEEANDFYPGLAAFPFGYIPVGSCLIGTGDPYFIRLTDTEPCPLYRIYHDACSQSGLAEGAVVVVLQSYRDLLRYIEE